MNKQTYIIKLGGSLITNKAIPNTPRLKVIRAVLNKIKEFYDPKIHNLLIGNGVGSFAHVPARKYQTMKGIINKESVYGAAVVKQSALEIHNLVYKQGLEVGLPLFSLAPSSYLLAGPPSRRAGPDKSRAGDLVQIKTFLSPLVHCLKIGLVPFFYGDVILDIKQGFTIYSTEKSIEIIAQKLLALKFTNLTVIHLGSTNGVIDANQKTITLINKANFVKVKKNILGSQGIDVTGGMLHKVKESLKLAKLGVKVIIANGNELQTKSLPELLHTRCGIPSTHLEY